MRRSARSVVRMPLPSLFERRDADAVLDRIRGLKPGTPAQWGKMDVAQMLAHVQPPIQVALGELELKRSLLGLLLGRFFKKEMTNARPFQHDLPTDKRFLVRDRRDFATEQAALVALVERFQRGGPDAIVKKPHPFFGRMTPAEWSMGMWKHLDHHLRQFGA